MNNTVNNRTFSFGKLFLLSFMQLMFRCRENLGLEKGNLSDFNAEEQGKMNTVFTLCEGFLFISKYTSVNNYRS